VTEAGARPVATPSQTVGPFFRIGLTEGVALGVLTTADTPGNRMRLRIRVIDGDGLPAPDCVLEIYQANAAGEYGHRSFSGFGRLGTDGEGACVFETIHPGPVADTRGGFQAPHVDVCLFARGLLRHLYTRIYFQGDAGLDRDPVLSLVPVERRDTLLAVPGGEQDGQPPLWEFAINLQGDRETVFLDL
jgi:protocatechuate 3,4-dioxygenase alpha subunit